MPANRADDRALIARIASNSRWAKEPDRSAATAAARSANDKRFELQVDPDGKLDPAERARRAASARKAHMQTMSLKAAQARRAKGRTRPAAS